MSDTSSAPGNQAQTQITTAEQPAVKRMVLFKHGVAYLERGGPARGSFQLSFKRSEMNDVLKSLAVWVAAGDATLGAIGFEKPEDPEDALAERKLNFAHGGALHGLLGTLRGRRVSVLSNGTPAVGEVLGLEQESAGNLGEKRTLLLRTSAGSIQLVDLASVSQLDVLEEKSKADLEYLQGRNRAATAGETRFVDVQLTGHATDVRVSYIVPAPTWRVSYRISIGKDEVTAVGFGIVHNPADEDLNDIALTLTTGQPVSFVTDLYNPKTVARAVVEETERITDAPPVYESRNSRAAIASVQRLFAAMPAPASAGAVAGDSFGTSNVALRAQAEDAAEGAVRGEFFEYRIRTPISIKRGGSAMVPLFASSCQARKERIWREGSPTPELVLTFENATGAVLEEGPAVVYADDVYAGEAMVRFSARGATVRLGFAKDLAIRCSTRHTDKLVATRVQLIPHFLREEYRNERTFVLIVESDHDEPVDVLFELPRSYQEGATIVGLQPVETTAHTQRFNVTATPHGKVETSFVEMWTTYANLRVVGIDRKRVRDWFDSRFLDGAALGELEGLFKIADEVTEHDARTLSWGQYKDGVFARISKLTEQLSVLKEAGPEGELRLRYVKELGDAQSEVARAEAALAEHAKQKTEAQVRLTAAMQALGGAR